MPLELRAPALEVGRVQSSGVAGRLTESYINHNPQIADRVRAAHIRDWVPQNYTRGLPEVPRLLSAEQMDDFCRYADISTVSNFHTAIAQWFTIMGSYPGGPQRAVDYMRAVADYLESAYTFED